MNDVLCICGMNLKLKKWENGGGIWKKLGGEKEFWNEFKSFIISQSHSALWDLFSVLFKFYD